MLASIMVVICAWYSAFAVFTANCGRTLLGTRSDTLGNGGGGVGGQGTRGWEKRNLRPRRGRGGPGEKQEAMRGTEMERSGAERVQDKVDYAEKWHET